MAVNSFRICSFNTENLLHPGIRWVGRSDAPYTESEYEEKIRWISGILREGRVDLVGLQEQFSWVALERLARDAELSHVFAPQIEDGANIVTLDGKPAAKGPYVALASRFPIVQAKTVSEFPERTRRLQVQGTDGGALVTLPLTQFQRPVIQADVQLKEGVVATVFVAHLKSKRPQIFEGEDSKDPLVAAMGNTRSLIVRAAESVALRQLVLDAVSGTRTPVLLFGDLNDDLASVTTQTIAGEEPFFMLPTAKKAVFWDRLLYSAHDLEEQESYRDVSYTHIFDGRYQLLDHIFVSQEFTSRYPDRVAAVRSTRIFNDHLVDVRRVDNPKNGASRRSDHGVPVTEIWWR